MDYCHQKRIVHRDLKLSNIVFASPNSKEIRVVDFGISGLNVPLNHRDNAIAGSLRYMAPEVITGKHTSPDPSLDIFSMGVILFALVNGRLPFDGSDDLVKQNTINGCYQYSSSANISDECKDLIDGMLKVEPKERLTLKAI